MILTRCRANEYCATRDRFLHSRYELLEGTAGSGNVASGDPNATYLADDRPVQGQAFTTGSNPSGYLLTALTRSFYPAGFCPLWHCKCNCWP